MTIKTRPYDAANYLHNETDDIGYLTAVLEEEDVTEQEIASALGDIARARGMRQVAADAGVSRESLYRTLSVAGNPTLATTVKVMKALGMRLAVQAA